MKREYIIILVVALLLLILFGYNLFKPTGYAIDTSSNSQNLIINLRLQPDSLKVRAGENLFLLLNIREINVGSVNTSSIVNLKYSIQDLGENILSFKEESGELRVKESEVVSLLIPTDTKPGIYIAAVEVEYGGQTYMAKKTFEVVDVWYKSNFFYFLIILILFTFLLFFMIKKTKKKRRTKKS